MRVLQINSVIYGSTGKIMFSIADVIKSTGGECLCTSGFTWKKTDRNDFFLTSGIIEKIFHTYAARLTGYNGCFSIMATRRLLKKIDHFKPDIIHMHNIHGWFVNLPMLFKYLKKHKEIKVVWTLHDCWSVTGQCPHFTMAECDKWKTGCYECSQCNTYPHTYVDRSEKMYRLKKSWFNGVEGMTIVTPSKWLKNIIEQSYLKDYKVNVIHNGINLDVFHPRESDFREKYHLQSKYILLGVSYAWDNKKGLDDFLELAKRLPEKYQIVLVGTDDKVDSMLPMNITSIHRTHNQEELAEIYTAADLFVNPTKEENYPTVHMEALACGTPVVTYNTGGAGEMLNEKCGTVIPYNDIDKMEEVIRNRCECNPFTREECLFQAKKFDEKERYEEYLELYKKVL